MVGRPEERGLVQGGEEAVLGAISRPETSMAVWLRPMPVALQTWSDRLHPEQIPNGRVLMAPDEAGRAVDCLFSLSRTPAGAGRALFKADVCDLVWRFAAASGGDMVDLRVEHVRHDACWRFHRDQVRLRMICTYRGPGTEYVPRDRYDDALERQRDYDGPTFEVPRFAVALFKGAMAGMEDAVVHRSPPIAGRGLSRLMICLNQPSSASPRPFSESL